MKNLAARTMASRLRSDHDVAEHDLCRWEWRTFADDFEPSKLPWLPEFETTDRTFVVCPESNARVAIRDDNITVDRLDDDRDGVELWRRTVDAAFPLCQHDVRDVLREFPVTVPPLYRPEYSPLAFVTDVATCTNGLRVAGVRGVRRRIQVDACTLERSVLNVAGRTLQSIAVSGADPDAVRAVLRRFGLDRLDHANIVALLKQLLRSGSTERIPAPMGDFSRAR